MINLLGLTLTDIVFFKGTTRFDFKPGMTFIQGRNLQRRGPTASNGSGKSLLFGTLPNVVLDTHPTITKNVRSVQKNIYGKGSSVVLDFAKGKSKYTYTKAGAKTALAKNGVDMQSRIARDQLRSLINYSEKEFFSTVYLDSRRPNTFLMGTSAERFDFMTEVFCLHNIDDFRKYVNRQISDLNSDGSVLDQTQEDLTTARSRLKALPKEAAEQAAELSAWLKKASIRAQRLTSTQHQWENYTRWSEQNEKLEAMEKPKHTMKELRALLSELDGYEAELRQWKRQQKEREGLQAEFDALKVDDSEYDAMLKRKNRLQPVDEPERPDGDLKIAKKRAAKVTRERAEELLGKARAKQQMLKEQLDTFNEEVGEADQCPTCHSELSASTKKAIRQNFESQIEELKGKIETAQAYIAAHKTVVAFERYEEELDAYNKYKAEAREIKAYPFADVRRWRELKTLLSANEIKKPTPPKSLVFGNNREKLEESLRKATKWNQQKQLVDSLATERPDVEVDADAIAKLNDEVSEKMALLPELQAKASERKTVLATIKELKERAERLAEGLEDLPVYRLLSEAYGNKGVKVLMVQKIAKMLEKNLNKHARQVFAEDFKFTLNVADGRFDVNVTRRSARKEVTSDIRMMSGAESRLFIFLFVMALLPLIPSDRRMNTLILDEPDANMDPEAREIFRDSLLPRLSKVVPCLIVISPNKDIVPQHARVFTVVKDKGVSTLVEGFA